MPMYEIMCPCGCEEGFASIKQWEDRGRMAQCTDCDAWEPTFITPVASVGVWSDRPLEIKQIGRTFYSEKELNDYCKAEGVEWVSHNDSHWQAIKSEAKEGSEAQAREEGYQSRDEQRRRYKRDKRDRLMAAREAKLNEYHSEHGGKAKYNAVETAFKTGGDGSGPK